MFYISDLQQFAFKPTINNSTNPVAGLRPATLVVVVGLINNFCKLETYAKITLKPYLTVGAIELPLHLVLLHNSYQAREINLDLIDQLEQGIGCHLATHICAF